MPVFTLNIPDDIENALSSMNVKREEFIITALKEKINFTRKNDLLSSLTEGYKNNHEENNQLIKDFLQTDLENWNEY